MCVQLSSLHRLAVSYRNANKQGFPEIPKLGFTLIGSYCHTYCIIMSKFFEQPHFLIAFYHKITSILCILLQVFGKAKKAFSATITMKEGLI